MNKTNSQSDDRRIVRDFADRFAAPPPGLLDGESILITGGTGSFGKAFVRTILQHYKPERFVIFSRDELKQFEMQHSADFAGAKNIRYFIGDVRDEQRLETAFRGINIVIHAAAMKQVPIAEYNPFECIRTNVHGAENVVNAAMRVGVKKVLALSTDKACNPVNLYGASKLASDKIFVAGNNLSGQHGPRFAAVRYGNVIGSRGSVIPYFQKLIADGAPDLPITDERMTRFWIKIEQGVNFVLSALEIMRGGEIFVPRIPSMGVADVARALAPHLPINKIGVRPGEKIHETLIPWDEARSTLELGDRYIIEPQFAWWNRASYQKDGATSVDADFRYASDSNSEWLDADGLKDLLGLGKRTTA